MWAYVAAYKMPNDDPEALERRVRIAYPVRADRLLGGGTTPTLRLQRALGTPGGFRAWEKLLVWSHWIWFAFPHGTVLYLIFRRPERVPERRRADLRDVRHRTARLLGGADRAALVRRGRRADGRRAHARAAAHDGRVRRALLEVRLGPAVRCPRGQSPGRHALAALRDIRHGRARARRDRRSSPASLGWTLHAACSASRSSTSASTTSSTSRPASRWPRACAPARRPRRRWRSGCPRAVQALELRARA